MKAINFKNLILSCVSIVGCFCFIQAGFSQNAEPSFDDYGLNIDIGNLSDYDCIEPGDVLTFDVTTRAFAGVQSETCASFIPVFDEFTYEINIGPDVITFNSNDFSDTDGSLSGTTSNGGSFSISFLDGDFDLDSNPNGEPALNYCEDVADNPCDCGDPDNLCSDNSAGNCDQLANDQQVDWYFQVSYTVPSGLTNGDLEITASESGFLTLWATDYSTSFGKDPIGASYPETHQEPEDNTLTYSDEVANAGTDQSGTTLDTFTLAADEPSSACTGEWTGPSTATFSNTTSPTSTVTFDSSATGDQTLTWTVTCGDCVKTDEVVISLEALASISGNVSLDTDNDDLGDENVVGVTVTLTNDDTGAVLTEVTDGNGNYLFSDLEPGNYTVSYDEPVGQQSVSDFDESTAAPDTDGNDGATPNNVIPVVLDAGELDADNDFVDEELGSISGTVLEDTNNDDVGDTPIEGVEVALLDENGDPVLDDAGNPITDITDANGDYNFDNLPPGDYQVVETDPDGYVSVSDTDGANNNTVGDETPITVVGGQDTPGNDFVDEQLVAVGNLVFNDVNNNGTFEAAEDVGIDGVTVEIYNAADDTFVASTETAGGGLYFFDELAPGDYYVVIPETEFVAGGGLLGFASTIPDGTGDATDNDDNGQNPATQLDAVQSDTFTLLPGDEITGENQDGYVGTLADANVNGTIDFGFIQVVDVFIRGIVFLDRTANDLVDGVQFGTPGTYAVLVDANTGLVIDTQLIVQSFNQADSGTFEFVGQSGQSYYVVLLTPNAINPLPVAGDPAPITSTLPADFVNVSDAVGDGTLQDGVPDGISTVFTTFSEDVINVNFGVLKAINIVFP